MTRTKCSVLTFNVFVINKQRDFRVFHLGSTVKIFITFPKQQICEVDKGQEQIYQEAM